MRFSSTISKHILERLRDDGSWLSDDEWVQEHPNADYPLASMHEMLEHLREFGGYEVALATIDNKLWHMKRLLNAGVSVSKCDASGHAPLHWVFIRAWRFMEVRAGEKYPALHVLFDDRTRVRAATYDLLEAGADPDCATSKGVTPLQFALRGGWLLAAQLLRERGAVQIGDHRVARLQAKTESSEIEPHWRNTTLRLLDSLENNDWENLKNEIESSNEQPHWHDVVALFMSNGGNLEMTPGVPVEKTEAEEQALCDLRDLEELKNRERKQIGLEVRERKNVGTLLDYALEDGRDGLAAALLDAGAHPPEGIAAFHEVVSMRKLPVISRLLQAGRSPNSLYKDHTPLESLIHSCRDGVIFDEGALYLPPRRAHRYMEQPDFVARPPYLPSLDNLKHRNAVLDHVLPITHFLLDHGARVRWQTMLLAASRSIDVFALLWPHCGRLSVVQATDIMFSLLTTPDSVRNPAFSRLHFIRELLEMGADPNFTPNHLLPDDAVYFRAQRLGDTELCQLLEDMGAEPIWLRKISLID